MVKVGTTKIATHLGCNTPILLFMPNCPNKRYKSSKCRVRTSKIKAKSWVGIAYTNH